MGYFSFRKTLTPFVKEYQEVAGNEMSDIIAYIENNLGLVESDVLGGYDLSTPTSIILEVETDAVSTIQDLKKPIPLRDEVSRDAYFPNPTIGDSYYNARLGGVREWYYGSFLGLWINSKLIRCLNSNSILLNRIVYIDGDDVYNGKEYATVDYPSNTSQKRRTFGVSVGSGLNNFISVATSGEYYVATNQTILAGEVIRSDDDGFALGFSGSTQGGIGYAIEDSGATVLGKVLIKIGWNT